MLKTFAVTALVSLISLSAFVVSGQKLAAIEIVAKHLDSVGTADARAAVKNRIAVGDATVTFITPKRTGTVGRVVMVSQDSNNFFGLQLNAANYPLERFVFDGKSPSVAMVLPGTRSLLGNFVRSNSKMIEDSVFGGVLATSWALFSPDLHQAKLSSGSIKKIDGKEVYMVTYASKGGGDLTIQLYFEKETFRHVRTEYKRISSAGIGTSPDQSSQFNESRLALVENFGDFKTENGLTLPHSYSINYTIAGQNGTTEIDWKFALTEFAINQKLDAQTFNANVQ